MANLVAVLLFGLAVILQNSIVTRINLLVGAADLVLLVLLSWVLQADETRLLRYGVVAGIYLGVSSAVPLWVPILGYSIVVGLVMVMKRKIWQAPYWLLLTTTFIGTVIVYGLEIVVFWVSGYPFDLIEMFNLVILPSVVLNMLIVLPVYFFVGEITKFVYPKEVHL